ncbi:hypothetical protein IFR05_010522 [Cadophora sp. M221]|nr:hypothetical protein IFR05_010522 [Cadophora sp. M221]
MPSSQPTTSTSASIKPITQAKRKTPSKTNTNTQNSNSNTGYETGGESGYDADADGDISDTQQVVFLFRQTHRRKRKHGLGKSVREKVARGDMERKGRVEEVEEVEGEVQRERVTSMVDAAIGYLGFR